MKRLVITTLVLFAMVGMAEGAQRKSNSSPAILRIRYSFSATGVKIDTIDGTHIAHDGTFKFVRIGTKPQNRNAILIVSRVYPNPSTQSYDIGDACQFKLGKHSDTNMIVCTPESDSALVIRLDIQSIQDVALRGSPKIENNRDGPQVVVDGSGGFVPPGHRALSRH